MTLHGKQYDTILAAIFNSIAPSGGPLQLLLNLIKTICSHKRETRLDVSLDIPLFVMARE